MSLKGFIMKKNRIKSAILVVSIILTIISGVWLTQTNNKLYILNNEYDKLQQEVGKITETITNKVTEEIQTYPSVDINAPVYKGEDIEKLEEQVKSLEFKRDVYSTPKEDFRQLVSNYVKARYNYNGTSKSQCSKVIKAISPYVDESMNEEIREEMNESLHGNGNVSDDYKHTGELVNLYLGEITKVGTNSNLDVSFDYVDTFMVEGSVKVKFNDSSYRYSNIVLSISYDKPEWKISSDLLDGYCFLNY